MSPLTSRDLCLHCRFFDELLRPSSFSSAVMISIATLHLLCDSPIISASLASWSNTLSSLLLSRSFTLDGLPRRPPLLFFDPTISAPYLDRTARLITYQFPLLGRTRRFSSATRDFSYSTSNHQSFKSTL